MRIKELVVVLGMALLSQSANAGCDAALTTSLEQACRLADSLRADKPGLARIFASDGSEFTAGQARWLKSRLREVERACSRGQQLPAAAALAAVQELIKAHAPRG